jgi:hypothetical protein
MIIDGTLPIDKISMAELVVLKAAIDDIISKRVYH